MAAAPSLLLPALPPSPSTRSAPLPLPPDPRLRPPAPALLLREGGGDLDLATGVSSSSLTGTGAPCRLATVRRCLSWRGSWRSSPPAATSDAPQEGQVVGHCRREEQVARERRLRSASAGRGALR